MATFHRKVKSVAKVQVPSGPQLDKAVLETMKTVSALVGATLGPGGKVVAIERQEFGIPDLVTKDGVTVFRSLGFNDPVAHSIMGLARDASVRTADEAGDGTTTATVLAEAFVRYTHEFVKKYPKVSPQKVVRTIDKIFRTDIEPYVKSLAIQPDHELLLSVAMCSTNGDLELTGAVAKCFELTGDEGNITITESSGKSGYTVQPVKGYTVRSGFESCTGKFFSVFVNDNANNRVLLQKPCFVLYNGTVPDLTTIIPILHQIGLRWGGPEKAAGPHNVVVVANGFSDQCLGQLAANWPDPMSLNIYPLVLPQNAMQSGQLDALIDIAAVTGSTIFDPITKPVQQGTIEDIGTELEYFESTRTQSNIVGLADEGLILGRVEEIDLQLPNAESIVERNILNERKGKLSGGIARLVISAPTSGELREKKDRADDAVCAWRGAVKHGALPGGGWTLLMVIAKLGELLEKANEFEKTVLSEVMAASLVEPVKRLLQNCGYNEEEATVKIFEMLQKLSVEKPMVFDALEGEFKPVRGSGVVDSLPAVLEAIRNSISIATQLGTLGGMVVFPRDAALEREQASDTYDFMKNGGM